MKKITNNILLGVFAVASVGLSSCFKKFDTESYAPALNIGGFTSANAVGEGSLVGYWSFNGTLTDSISNTTGTNSGTTFSPGIKGQALQGANSGYVLATPSSAILNMSSFTISYWVNSPVNSSGIVGTVNLANTNNFWGNVDMFFENGSTQDAAKFRIHVTNNSTTDAWLAKDGIPGVFGNWTAMAVTYNAGTNTFKYYINGSTALSQTIAGYGPLKFTNSGKIVFGAVHFQTSPSQTSSTGSQPWASYLTGQLDEVRIYNKALTDAEVNSLVKLEGRGK